MAFFILLAALAAFMYYGNYTLEQETFELRFDDLPEAFDGYRITVVSDLHAAVFGKGNGRLLDAVRAAKPDMIALTGDATDGRGQIPGVIETVRGLAEIAPVYYVTGNHEWEAGEARELMRALPGAGAEVLRNEIIPIERGGETIYLAGLEDPNGPADMKKPAEVFAGLPEGFCVTLVHRNTFLEHLAPLGARLILCGHGHGGLIRLPGIGGLIGHDLKPFPKYSGGRYTIGETEIIVSRGVGNHTGVPRIFNRPHIPTAVLRRGT
ncbi:MAG: metallophosphoesterase [Oscillospiraceae bacterium]|jgi:predicted MPP superfamily phosphohydrolase|nr:metallophosphoesterase [Oscillospiraceae bacterium]